MRNAFAISFLLCFALGAGAQAAMELQAPDGPMPADAPGLRVGDQAPDFTATTAGGKSVTLSEQYAKGPVVLVFYRGAWCPYCSLHLRSFQARLADIQSKGASVLAVSVDTTKYAAKAAQENSLGFDVVSDPQAGILEAYKVKVQVPAELAEQYLREYNIDLEAHSGRKDHVLAVPATYVIDTAGKITFAYANLDYKMRATPEQVLSALSSDHR